MLSLGGCGDSALPNHDTCAADRDCDRGVCVARETADPVDQAELALGCAVVPDAGADMPCCQTAEDCARGICLVSGACVAPCIDATDCAENERCALVFARAGRDALQTTQACVSRVEAPNDVLVTESLLADVLTTDASGVAIDLPAVDGTGVFVLEHRSETLWPLTVECRTPLCVSALRTRDDTPTTLFDVSTLRAGNVAPLNTVNTSVDALAATILLPNSPRSVRSDVGYRATLRTESSGDLAVTLLERQGSATTLDLHVHYVTDALRPEGTRGPPLVADALEHTETIFAQAGITLGNVCQTEVVGALRDRLSVIDPPRFGLLLDLPELFALSAGARGSAIHVFLVDQADVALGISGGVPGPPGVHGTGSSGVVMSVALFDSPQQLGRALAHELGHYLGLFHPREADDVTLDPLGNTPNEATNLMFRTATGGQSLTDAQRSVLAESPLLR